MRDLLYLVHRMPFPPDKGDKIRSFHWLRQLAEQYRVHLATFIDDENDWQYVDTVNQYCASSCFRPLNKRTATLKSFKGFFTGQALTLPYYYDAQLQNWVNATVYANNIDQALVFSSSMAQYLPVEQTIRNVLDLVDVDSDKWRQYAQHKPWYTAWVYRREHRLLAKAENLFHAQAAASVLVSDHEAALFRQQIGAATAASVYGVPNGVDTDYFDPTQDVASPFDDSPHVVFVGAMDYWANVDAVVWFCKEVWPLVLAAVPGAKFVIVGSNPGEEVKRLASSSIQVTGRVEDVRAYVKYAHTVVASLRIARGIQNKVLEAFSMARPLVATPAALEGLEGGEAFAAVADDPQAYAQAVVDRLGVSQDNPKAREWVKAQYSWPGVFAQLNALLKGNQEKESAHVVN